MGRAKRETPKRLGEKLLFIRECIGISQNGMIVLLDQSGKLRQSDISDFEISKREPPLGVLCAYAAAAAGGANKVGDYLVKIIDDSKEMPKRLPGAKALKAEKVRREYPITLGGRRKL